METLDAIQARHRKEQRDLQSRITSKKKNATKKTRKGVNDECATLERELKERQEHELAIANGDGEVEPNGLGKDGDEPDNDSRENTPGEASIQSGNDTTTETNGITDRLKRVTFTSDTPTQTFESTAQTQSQSQSQSQGQDQEQGQQGGGKKRNRQKERMARRAAEREEAAEAAEREAQDMTDHRGLEREGLERAFRAHGLVEHEIRPDGHCLFSAVADQLAQGGIDVSLPFSSSSTSTPQHNTTTTTKTIPTIAGGKAEAGAETEIDGGKEKEVPSYRLVRRAATSYMQAHADDFAPFLEEPLDAYVAKIRDTAEWGGQLELLALASAYGVEIRVVQDTRVETIRPSSDSGDESEGEKIIWLAYYRHGYGLGEHYNSLRKKGI
ncbi:OTU domain-containing protein 6B [Nemania sp. FL0916]|nr:OTU domain-containing protein 6B [Nemania sp. FL0916]